MVKSISIGELDTVIEILSITKTKDPLTGDSVEALTVLGKVSSKRIDLSGGEENEGKEKAENVRKYIMRYSTQIVENGTTMYVRDIDGDYNINHVGIIGRMHMISLKCTKSE